MTLEPVLSRGSRRFHYAWVVLACGFAATAITAGVRQSFSVFVDPLAEQFAWSRGSISFAYSLAFFAWIPVSLVAGWLGDVKGARQLFIASAAFFTLGMVLIGTITQLWQFYIYWGIIVGGLGSTVVIVVLPVVVTRWFHKRVGLATGLIWAATGLGPVVAPPFFHWIIAGVGWQQAFLVVGLTGGAVMLFGSLLLRGRPEDMSQHPYGQAFSSTTTTIPDESSPVQFKQVRSTSTFRLLTLIHFLGCASHSVILAHVVPMATFAGIPGLSATGIISTIAGASVVTRFGVSVLTEKLGAKKPLLLSLILQTAPLFILFWSRELWQFYMFAGLFGLGFGGEMVGYPIINRQYYGRNAPLGTIYSYQLMGASLGMGLGGWIGGILFDITGSYIWSLGYALITGGAAIAATLFLPNYNPSMESIVRLHEQDQRSGIG